MSAREFLGWRLLWESDPDTLERRDYMLAQTAAVQCVKTKATDLMPWKLKEEETTDPKAQAQAVADKGFAIFGMVREAYETREKRK